MIELEFPDVPPLTVDMIAIARGMKGDPFDGETGIDPEAIAALQAASAAQGVTLGEHTTSIAAQGGTIAAQGVTLGQHTASIAAQGITLGQHGTTLAAHSTAIDDADQALAAADMDFAAIFQGALS